MIGKPIPILVAMLHHVIFIIYCVQQMSRVSVVTAKGFDGIFSLLFVSATLLLLAFYPKIGRWLSVSIFGIISLNICLNVVVIFSKNASFWVATSFILPFILTPFLFLLIFHVVMIYLLTWGESTRAYIQKIKEMGDIRQLPKNELMHSKSTPIDIVDGRFYGFRKLLAKPPIIIFVGITVFFIAGVALFYADTKLKGILQNPSGGESQVEEAWTYDEALPPLAPIKLCETTDKQLQLTDIATSIIEIGNGLSLETGAEQFLASAQCMRSDTFERVEAALDQHKGFGNVRLVEYQLALASRLPHPSDLIIDEIAASAFNSVPQESQWIPHKDIRPFARTVLARFGNRCKSYGKIAYAQISGDTAMGTGAAQVAAAAGYPGSLERVSAILEAALNHAAANKNRMGHDKYVHLVELAWAFELAGDAGKQYQNKFCPLLRSIEWPGSVLGAPPCLRPATAK